MKRSPIASLILSSLMVWNLIVFPLPALAEVEDGQPVATEEETALPEGTEQDDQFAGEETTPSDDQGDMEQEDTPEEEPSPDDVEPVESGDDEIDDSTEDKIEEPLDAEDSLPFDDVEDVDNDVTDAQPTVSVDEQVTEKPKQDDGESTVSTSATKTPTIQYRGHVQNIGWMKWVKGGKTAGTSGRSLRVEGFELKLMQGNKAISGISYKAHVQNIGWQDWVSDGKMGGTSGRSLRVEALKIRLSDELAEQYDVYYRTHIQNIGWLNWAKNGAPSGSTGKSLRVEAMQVVIVEKGAPAPSANGADKRAFYDGSGISGSAHIQNIGWKSYGSGRSVTFGTTGKGLRVEAVKLSLSGFDMPGGITYQSHVQNIGWQSARKSGVSGTTGKSLRIEAFNAKLTGEIAEKYDLWYRVHVQNYGWLDWTCNGANAGTVGFSKRCEAIQFKLVPKGSDAPGASNHPFLSPPSVSTALHQNNKWQKSGKNGTAGVTGKLLPADGFRASISLDGSGVSEGGISYSLHKMGGKWTSYGANGADVRVSGKMDAIKIKLTGEAAEAFDVWYRVHVANIGWLGWTKNDAPAGSDGLPCQVEAVQIAIVLKNDSAPGLTGASYVAPLSGDNGLDYIVYHIIATKTGGGYQGLRNAYEYVSSYGYRTQDLFPSGSWQSWSKRYAKEMYYMGRGNCYRYAALFCWIARGLGYDARAISGKAETLLGFYPHSWVEIHQNGEVYVVDTEMHDSHPGYNFFMVTYANAPVYYQR